MAQYNSGNSGNSGNSNKSTNSIEPPKLFYPKAPVIYDAPIPLQTQSNNDDLFGDYSTKRAQAENAKVKVNWSDPSVFSAISQEVNKLDNQPKVYNHNNYSGNWNQPPVNTAYISPPIYGNQNQFPQGATNNLNTGYNTYPRSISPNPTYPITHPSITPNTSSQVYPQNYNIPTVNSANSISNNPQNITYTVPNVTYSIPNNTPTIITPRWETIENERKLKKEEAKRKEEEIKKNEKKKNNVKN